MANYKGSCGCILLLACVHIETLGAGAEADPEGGEGGSSPGQVLHL